MDTMSSQLGNLRSPVSKPEFHEIDNLTISNLRDIIENESSFDFFFQNTIAVKRACSAHEELMHEIVSAASK